MPKETIILPEVPRYLRKEFEVKVSYRRVYTAVLNGDIPAEKDDTGTRWKIKVDDLPEIAKAMKPKNVEDLAPQGSTNKIHL